MSTPEERRRIWREEQEAKTAEGRRRIWARERQRHEPPQSQPQPSAPSPTVPTGQNLAVGAARGYLGLTEPVEAAGDIISGLFTGDTRPLKEAGRRLALGVGRTYAQAGLAPGADVALNAAIEQEAAQSKQRRLSQGDIYAARRAGQEAQLSKLEAQDPSLRGKITRGVVSGGIQSLPYIAAGAGGVPALAATGAAMSLGAPENLPLNVALATLPAPAVGKYVAPILRRIRGGRNVPVAGEVAPAVAEAVQPVGGQASPTVQRAMRQFDEAVQRINASNLTPRQKAAELEKAVAQIGREASGIRPVSEATRRGYPPQMVMPDAPNPIQQAGPLPRVFGEAETPLPAIEAELGVSAAPSVSGRGASASVSGPAAESAAMQVGAAAKPSPPGVSPDERTAMLEAFLDRPSEAWPRQPQQLPVLEGVPGPVTEAQRARLLESVLEKQKPAGQRQLFSDDVVAPAERTKFLEAVSAVRKAGLLRITSHLKNVAGTGPWQVQEEIARIPGAILDIVLSPATRRRTFTGPNFGAVARSAYEAATKGTREAWQIWRKGATADDLARLGLDREINTGNKIVDWYVNRTFRALAAEDRVFRVYAMRRSLEDRARSIALTEVHKGEIPRSQLAQRTSELVKSPTADMQAGAVLDADVATFNQANFAGRAREAFRGTKADFAIDNVVPFAKTPTNVIGALLEASPLGYGKNAYQIARAITKKSFTAEQQRQFAQTFGRATAGSGLVALGYVGYRDGWLTGLQEDDTSRRARDTATGRVPGAIRINGKWHQLSGFAPWGSLIAIGASIAREAEQEQMKAKEEGRPSSTARAVATAAPEVFGRAVIEQPLLAGPKQIIEGFEQPGSFGAKALGGLVGSYVPGHVSDVGQLLDYGKQREANTLAGRVLQRVPGARETLPEKLDVLGRPQEAPFPLDPTRGATGQQFNNPLFAELVRLDIGISGFQKKKDETDERHRAKAQDFGAIYIPYGLKLVSSPQYQQAPDEIRREAVKILNSRAKTLIEDNRQRFAAGPLSPQALVGSAINAAKREAAKKNAGK